MPWLGRETREQMKSQRCEAQVRGSSRAQALRLELDGVAANVAVIAWSLSADSRSRR